MYWKGKIQSVYIFPFSFCGNSFYFCFHCPIPLKEEGVKSEFYTLNLMNYSHIQTALFNKEGRTTYMNKRRK